MFPEPTAVGPSRRLKLAAHETPLPIQAFAKDPDLTRWRRRCFAINLRIVQKAGSGPVHHRNPEPAVNHPIAWFAMKNYAAISCADGRTDELSLR